MYKILPDWELNFRDFPEIHPAKRFIKSKKYNREWDISLKLMAGEPLNKDEIQILTELLDFYEDYGRKISEFEFTTLSDEEILKFKWYIRYVHNVTVYLSSDISLKEVFRLVINENIIGSKKSLTSKNLLSYPPASIVKNNNKYNRANTPDYPMFYCSESINTALFELKPNVGDLVTVGVWRPITNHPFETYIISHNEDAYEKNAITTKSIESLKKFKDGYDKHLTLYIESYLKLLGKQYSKKVNHHYEYLVSALISEKILENPELSKISNPIECLTYPSIENKFKSNFAFRPDIIDSKWNLFCAIEFQVTKQHFDRIPNPRNNSISLVSVENLRMTMDIKNEEITW